MPLAANQHFPILAILLASLASCGRSAPPAPVPASTAYSDGFRVVVFDVQGERPTNIRHLLLKDAEQAIEAGAQALIPGDAAAIQQQLSTGKSGDSRALVTMEQLGDQEQRVRLAFHESNRTFVYEYAVEGTRIMPVLSEYRDLAKSNVVRYSRE